jgi:hypothetical protein
VSRVSPPPGQYRDAAQRLLRVQVEKMKPLLTVIGIILMITGLVFTGQGSGYFSPASSFMISQTRWIYYAGAIALAGLILVFLGRR